MTPAQSFQHIVRPRDAWRANSGHPFLRRVRSTAVLEQEVERLSARVAELERDKAAVEAFAAVAAHELLEPLVMTEAYVAMVADRLDEQAHAESRRDLDALTRASARMRLLVETLLHDARSGGRALRRQPVKMERLVRECLGMLRPEIEAHRARIEVAELPTLSVEETLLGGVFKNLLANALKYSARQGSLIRIGAERGSEAWVISVVSEGTVIPPADRERIFEPFHRGRGERRARGAGLGLSICRNIVERHGGTIGVEPAATGSGNRFFFTLPDVSTAVSAGSRRP